jgi:hypothetical protein
MDAGRAHSFNRKMWRLGLRFFVVWQAFVLGFTAIAALDAVGAFGWGYSARDVWFGLLLSGAGFAVLAFCWFIQRTVWGINTFIFGPEPSDNDKPNR